MCMKNVFMLVVLLFHSRSFMEETGTSYGYRDTSAYNVVNMFDTHQASHILQLPKNLLAFLLKYCCDVDKSYLLVDWRIR